MSIKNLTSVLAFLIIINPIHTFIQVLPSEAICEDSPLNSSTYPAVKTLGNGYTVIAWYDTTASKLVFQVYDITGVKQGSNIIVGTNTNGNRRYIEALTGNKIIIAIAYSGNLTAYVFNSSGTIIGSPISVNTDSPPFYDAVEIAQLDNAKFVVLWTTDTYSIYYKVYSSNYLPATASTLVLENTTQKYAPVIKPAGNTGFVICWIQASLLNDTVICRFFNSNVPTGSDIIIATYASYSRDPRAMSMVRLLDANYVITYNTYSSDFSTYYVILNSVGIVILPPTLINLQNLNRRSPDIASLSTGGFAIVSFGNTCPACNNNVYLQEYDSSYSPIGQSIVLNTSTSTDNTNASIVGLSSGGYFSVWTSFNHYSASSAYDIYFNIWTPAPEIICNDFSVYIKTQAKASIDFGLYVSYYDLSLLSIYFNSLPQYGQLLLTDGNVITTNTPYPYNIITYQSSNNYGNFIVTYTGGDPYGNHSLLCSINIYTCYFSCETCSLVGTPTDHTCLTCRSGYIQIGNSCFQSCPSNFGPNQLSYYYDSLTSSCLTCISPCNECLSATNCTTCVQGYLLLEGVSTNNCVTTCPKGYGQDGSICRKCDSLCTQCSGSSTNCSSCISTAFYLPDNKCVSKCPIGYILDNQNNCLSCQSINQFYSNGVCVPECPLNQNPDGNNICQCLRNAYNGVCYDTCPIGTVFDSANNTCYACSDVNKYFYNNSCVSGCPDYYYLTNNLCLPCVSTNMYSYQNSCVAECPIGTKLDSNLMKCIDLTLTITCI
jgi:hypothetical protein